MSASTSGQAEPPAGPGPGATPRGDSTSGQRAAPAGRWRRHVATLEGVRHPRAAPERHRAARDYVAAELGALGLTVALAPFTFRGRTHHNVVATRAGRDARRSEEHTSELQSQSNLVCRLLLEKKKTRTHSTQTTTK